MNNETYGDMRARIAYNAAHKCNLSAEDWPSMDSDIQDFWARAAEAVWNTRPECKVAVQTVVDKGETSGVPGTTFETLETGNHECRLQEKCCKIGCERNAEFEIFHESEPRPEMTSIFACEEHVGELLGSELPAAPVGPWKIYPVVSTTDRAGEPKAQIKNP